MLRRIGSINLHDKAKLLKRYSQIRWNDVELLTSIKGLSFSDVKAESQKALVGGLEIEVASESHMLVAKKAANRSEDHSDIGFLEGLIV